VLLGLAMGEVFPAAITPRAAGAFLYLLVMGSLLGFVAFNWLLGHVSPTRVGTYAYVNPAVAVLVGWAAGEPMTWAIAGGIGVVLLAVFLVRGGEQPAAAVQADDEPPADPAVAAEAVD
jgi:drug/metabolite transporter (DMT)-like permease